MSDAVADVAVVGAGPAGTAAAVHLGQLGVENVVLLDRHDFPRDKTCGSGISPKGIEALKVLGVWPEVERASYRINGLRLVTAGDREVYVSGGDDLAAVVCCRRIFDEMLLRRAEALGVRFVPNFDGRALLERDGRVGGVISKAGDQIRAKYTIIADGAHTRFAVNKRPRRLIQAIMGWWEAVPFRANHVEMVFDRMVLPYYGWLFPEGPSRVNIGICYGDDAHEKNARALFAAFLEKHYAVRLRGARQVGDFRGHPISYSHSVGELTSPGRIVVGEAGRMTHPATAEGIYQGMRSGMLAAVALAKVLDGRAREAAAFAEYEKRCKRAFGASFLAAKLVQKVVSSRVPDWIATAGQNAFVRRVTGRVMAQM
jgi:menaquinone-9 beta-reductase